MKNVADQQHFDDDLIRNLALHFNLDATLIPGSDFFHEDSDPHHNVANRRGQQMSNVPS